MASPAAAFIIRLSIAGAITISDDLLILVSSRVHGGCKLDDLFLALHGALAKTN
jgi:hypothetical protein